jgi:subtilase family serine protease
MKQSSLPAAIVASALMLAACGHGAVIPQAPPDGADAFARSGAVSSVHADCGPAANGFERCLSVRRTDASALAHPLTAGYGPSDLQSAYKLPSDTRGSGQVVAVVNAFDDPSAETDLAKYRSHYGLSACPTANGCFSKVNQQGQPKPLPPANSEWAAEAALDLDMISATCPNCHILLVEADDNTAADLGKSVDTSARLGAGVITTGFAMDEVGSRPYEKYYDHPGHMITAAIGDTGEDQSFPATSPDVTAVGGTTLTRAQNKRGWVESVFGNAAAGCSVVYAKPSWQKHTGCTTRAVGDVGADGDPTTGVAVVFQGQFVVFGGTAVSSPIIAGVYALAENAQKLKFGSYSYSHLKDLFGVQGAFDSNGFKGSTGNGTPDGVGAF